MSASPTLRDHVRTALVENLGLKVISLGSAVALWAFTQGPETAVRTFSVSIVSDMPPAEVKRQMITQLPNEIAVTLRGPRTQLADTHADAVGPLRLNLKGGRDAKIDLEPAMFNVPDGTTVEQIVPSSITVKWDDVIDKQLRIEVPRTGEPAPGCTVKGAVATVPAEVVATGPRSMVDIMQVARAAPFDVTGLGQGTHSVKLLLDRPSTTAVVYNTTQVTASLEIMRQLVTKTFSKLKVEVIGAARATTRPSTVTVIVTGTAEDLGAITPDAVVPRVEPKATGNDTTKPGNDNLPVLVDLPKGVTVQIDPPKVIAAW